MLVKTAGSLTFAFLSAAVVGVVVAQGTSSQDKLQERLLAQETELLNVIEAKIGPTLDKPLADQVLAVTLNRGRRKMEDHIALPESLSVKNYQISEPKTFRILPNAANLVG